MKICLTFDVEPDLDSQKYESLKKGIPFLLGVIDKYNIKATFFVPVKLIEKFPNYFKSLKKQNHEISVHGYEHERFDDLSIDEKKLKIEKSIKIYKKIFKQNPKGFRAPQHSIDLETLHLLKENNFLYDASYTPFNFLQLLFFPKKFKLWWKGFFTSRQVHKLDDNFYEVPTSSFVIPFVSLPLRIFPWLILKFYLFLLKLTNENFVFYAHSWDFIKLPRSKTDRYFNYTRFIKNLNKMINYLSKKNKNTFCKMEELIKK